MSLHSTARGTGAVLLGLVTATALVNATDTALYHLEIYNEGGEFTPEATFAYLFSRAVFQFMGGYLTGWFAPRYPMAHATTLGLLAALLSVPFLISALDTPELLWIAIFEVLAAIPLALVGAKTYLWTQKTAEVAA